MDNKKNIDTKSLVREAMERIAGVIFIDYTGVTIEQIKEIRRRITKTTSKMKMYKTSLV
ncbi:50S ribosomal protein L10, partial [Brachyspira hyodysenteriae]|uniref:50S ribosomal protein L10 n=1 Tax=Brachyspira hyodysenteriae TaxID=159 RepID=UPI000A26862C